MVYKRVRGWTSGQSLPVQTFVEYPPAGRQCILTAAVWMKQNQNAIAAINHQRAIRIKLHDHSWLFYQSLKKLAVVESYFRCWGSRFSGRCRCREVLGSFSIDDGNGSENVTFKMNFVAFIPNGQSANFPGVDFLRSAINFRERKRNSSSLVNVLHKTCN